jgi:hypothetical protein
MWMGDRAYDPCVTGSVAPPPGPPQPNPWTGGPPPAGPYPYPYPGSVAPGQPGWTGYPGGPYPAAVPVRKKRSKAPWLIGVGMLVMILVCCGGYWGYAYYSDTIKPRNQKKELLDLLLEYGAPAGFVNDNVNDSLYTTSATRVYNLMCKTPGCPPDATASVYGWAQRDGFTQVTLESLGNCTPNACTYVFERGDITVVLAISHYPAASPLSVSWSIFFDMRRHS